MAVAHDAFSSFPSAGTLDTDNLSWTHTPAGTPRGVVVFVIQDGATLETVSATYGGVAMSSAGSVDGSGISEPARIYTFFLGASVPTGAQTVDVTVSGSQGKKGVAYTVTAATDTDVDDFDQVVSSSQDDPSVNLTASATAQGYSVVFSGLGVAGNVAPGGSFTKDLAASTGGDSMNSERSTSTFSAGTATFNWTTTAADDVCMAAILIIEAAAGGDFPLDAAPGSYAVTGSVMAPLADRLIDATAGSYAVTGFQAQLVAGRAIDAGPGAYLITGAVADLVHGTPGAFSLDAQPGVYAVTGTQAGIVAGRVIVTDVGVFLVTGVADGHAVTRALLANPGAYVVTGSPADLDLSGQFVLLTPISTGRIAYGDHGGDGEPIQGGIADTVAGPIPEDSTE